MSEIRFNIIWLIFLLSNAAIVSKASTSSMPYSSVGSTATIAVSAVLTCENVLMSNEVAGFNHTQANSKFSKVPGSFIDELSLESVIYSPSVPPAGETAKPMILENQLLLSKQTSGSASSKYLLSLHRHYSDDYIGFVPTPDDQLRFQVAQLHWGYEKGLQLFRQGFLRRSTPEEIENIRHADEARFYHLLNSHRLGFAGVYKGIGQQKHPIAFLRVYDGTDYRRLGMASSLKNQSAYGYKMGSEISFQEQNIQTQVFEKWRDEGYQIFQIGKLITKQSEDVLPEENLKARNLLLRWLLDNYCDPQKMISKKVMFIMDVDTAIHQRTYGLLFGAKPIEENLFQPPLQKPLAILYVDLPTLREKLLKLVP